ncbi:MAG: 4-hydroxy-tetrahydrodipicolinate reductase [Parachlamydiales bacterium]|nr:4-hydroxy-tetrahydrodipicolinate reductase [Parachlamydiales bacterium]
MPIKIGIIGISGTMGQALQEEILEKPEFILSGGVRRDREELSSLETADVLIDFSHPGMLFSYLPWALDHKKPLVIGTTALSSENRKEMTKASQEIPILWSANFSMGIAYIRDFLQTCPHKKNEIVSCDILESHHSQKKDKPSGTALQLQKDLSSFIPLVTIHSIRAPHIVGIHEIIFHFAHETLTIKHEAFSRKVFAQGALFAAKQLYQKPPKLYTLEELL